MPRLSPLCAALLLLVTSVPAWGQAAEPPPPGDAPTEPLPQADEESSWLPDPMVVASRTCSALDAINLAYSDDLDDPTGPVVGGAVWGCYFGFFLSMPLFPMLPPCGAAAGAAFGGLVGAWNAGRPILPVLLWGIPGVLAGGVASAIGVALTLAASALFATAGSGALAPLVFAVIAVVMVGGMLAGLTVGPLNVALMVMAQDGGEPKRGVPKREIAWLGPADTYPY